MVFSVMSMPLCSLLAIFVALSDDNAVTQGRLLLGIALIPLRNGSSEMIGDRV